MTAHRELQRTLFRMQVDASFARAILAGDENALATTGLADADLALLRNVDARGISADPGGTRRMQIAGNAASEYLLTLAVAARGPRGAKLMDAFLGSPEFHAAMAANGRLPLAFGEFAVGWAGDDHALAALVALERGMASLRRAVGATASRLSPGEVQLSPAAQVLELPSGTLAWSALVREALDAGRQAPLTELPRDAVETILLHVPEAPHPHRLANVRLELLQPPADELMRLASHPLPRAARAAFARAHGAEPAELEAFLAPFVEEGVLVAGSD